MHEDVANQIAFSEPYRKEMKRLGLTHGQFLGATAAEWFQGSSAGLRWLLLFHVFLSEWPTLPGLPENWSDVGSVVKHGLVADIVGDWGVQDDGLFLF